MSTDPIRAWFLRSHADQDTHRGTWSEGQVRADCGISFAPEYLAIGSFALKGYPTDPDQVCQRCTKLSAVPPRGPS